MTEHSGPSGKQQETGEIDVSALSEDKIKQLMRSDPRFITRLINVGWHQVLSMCMHAAWTMVASLLLVPICIGACSNWTSQCMG